MCLGSRLGKYSQQTSPECFFNVFTSLLNYTGLFSERFCRKRYVIVAKVNYLCRRVQKNTWTKNKKSIYPKEIFHSVQGRFSLFIFLTVYNYTHYVNNNIINNNHFQYRTPSPALLCVKQKDRPPVDARARKIKAMSHVVTDPGKEFLILINNKLQQ